MTDDDRPVLVTLISAVFTYYGKEFSEAVFDIYWTGLKMYDLAAVKDALGRHAKNPDTGQFLPKIADVERMLGGSTVDSALVAFSKLEAAIGSVGAYRSVVFDDALIHRVVEDMGGWVVLARCPAKDWPFRQNEFVNRYRGFKARSERPPYPPKLIGIFEGENNANGFGDDPRAIETSKPILVGDAAAALLVLAAGSAVPRLAMTPMSKLTLEATKLLEDRA